MARRFYSALFWAFIVFISLVIFPIVLVVWAVTLPFDRRKRALHQVTCFWASLPIWFNPAWTVSIDGRQKLQSSRATVMVANHLSLLDILVLLHTFAHFKWVSKIEIFRVPIIGWAASLNGYIKLKRGDRASVKRMMAECEKTLGEGNSIMIFPEGTRSHTGRLRAFKTGAFELALRTGSPVQAIVIEGTAEVLPKRGFVLQGRHPIRVTVLDALSSESFEHLSVEELTGRVRGLIAAHLGEPTEPVEEGESPRGPDAANPVR